MRFHSELWMHALLHPSVVFGLPVAWVFCIYAFASYMTTRRVFEVKRAMQVYNVVQIAMCSYMVWGLSPCVGFPNIFGISSPYDEAGEWFVFVHYLSKYLDWFDTVWIVMQKRRQQMSFLHMYHHATIVMVWGFLLRMGIGNGTIRYGAWVNSLTHVIMYSHYLWTSFGLVNPLKRWVTRWQIIQFYSCLLHAFLVRALETTDIWQFAWLQIAYHFTMIYLFSLKMNYVPQCTPPMSKELDDSLERLAQAGRRYVVIRGEAYDVTDFAHPGGRHMLNLGVGRDATIMFESMHARLELAEERLKSLTKAPSLEQLEKEGHSFDRSEETWATPSQSELYKAIRLRVLDEVLRPLGKASGGAGARGVPPAHVASVLLGWAASAVWFVARPSALSGAAVGFGMCWVGLAIQHTANHGGLVANPKLGYLLGLLNDVIPGGSSLVWRYHHQVSHHSYCNDEVLDQDVHSSFPLLRLCTSQKLERHHRWQWLYGPASFCLLAASVQMQDVQCLLDARTFLINFKGSSAVEILLALALKFFHVLWFYMLPALIHGPAAMIVPWAVALAVGSFCLSSLFIVSHNVDTAKDSDTPLSKKGDWARYQIETSTSWGGRVGLFFTGGVNLQIEHHLFPALPHNLYVDVQAIVMEECQKRGIKYNYYPNLLPNFASHIRFLHSLGRPQEVAGKQD